MAWSVDSEQERMVPLLEEVRHLDFALSDGCDGTPSWDFWQATDENVVYASGSGAWLEIRVSKHTGDRSSRRMNDDWLPRLPEVPGGPTGVLWMALRTWIDESSSIEHWCRFAAHAVRGLGLCVVRVGHIVGLAPDGTSDASAKEQAWEWAAAAVQLGFYPWLSLNVYGEDPAATWLAAIDRIGLDMAEKVRDSLEQRCQIAAAYYADLAQRVGSWS
jgi:hypothetical protein